MLIWRKMWIEVLDIFFLLVILGDDCRSTGDNICSKNCGYRLRATLNYLSNVEALSLAGNNYFTDLPKGYILTCSCHSNSLGV